MPVLPHASLSQFRPSCGSGSGLRGVLPGAASWSRGSRRCEAGPPVEESLLQAYRIFGTDFVKIDGVTKAGDTRHFTGESAATLGYTYNDPGFAASDASSIVVLWEPVVTTPADMPASLTLGGATLTVTNAVGRFIQSLAQQGSAPTAPYVLDPVAPVVTVPFFETCMCLKADLLAECAPSGLYGNEGRPVLSDFMIPPPVFFGTSDAIFHDAADDLDKFFFIPGVPNSLHSWCTGAVNPGLTTYRPQYVTGAEWPGVVYTFGWASNVDLMHPDIIGAAIGTLAGAGDSTCP